MAVYLGLLGTGGRVLGMDLAAGGHLTHGAKVSFSGQYYKTAHYGLSRVTERLDYDGISKLAREFKPQIIFCGASAYPRKIDFAKFAEIAEDTNAFLVADVSHISGLCITGEHPHPFPHADIVTSTTHKMLRGPRGGMILCKKSLGAKIDRAVFPGLQGGPHNATISGIAVALNEADTPEFKIYCRQVVANAKALGEKLAEKGFKLVTGGTDTHLLLIDVTAANLTGTVLAKALDQAGIICNSNKIPFDQRPANDPSGIRIGTAAITSRKMKEGEMKVVADLISETAKNIDNENVIIKIRTRVSELCRSFPAPGIK